MKSDLRKYLSILACVFSALVISGCTSGPEWYKTSVNGEKSQIEQADLNGKPKSEVLAMLGIPEAQADLGDGREVWRYYGEELQVEVYEYGSHYTYRNRYHLEVWFRNGKVIRNEHGSRHFTYPVKPEEAATLDFPDNHYMVLKPHVSPIFNIGLPYDVSAAEQINANTPLSDLLWLLGLPNRIINSNEGEIFVYENSYFDTDLDINPQVKSHNAFIYNKDLFIVRDSVIADKQHFAVRLELKGLDSDHPLPNLVHWAMFGPAFALDALVDGTWTDCLEKSQSDTRCSEQELRQLFTKAWDKDNTLTDYEREAVSGVLYRNSDFDIGNVTEQRSQVFQAVSDALEQEETPPQVETLLVYRSSIPSVMKVGQTRLQEIFSSDKLQPYFQSLMTTEGEMARKWLNYGQVDKWYFTSQGVLDAAVHLSPISPASPWYALGPPASDLDIDPVKGASCTMFSSNCINPVSKIYRRSLVKPEI